MLGDALQIVEGLGPSFVGIKPSHSQQVRDKVIEIFA